MCNSPLICIIFTLAKQQSMKIKSLFSILMIFSTLFCCFLTITTQIQFQRGYLNPPNPYTKYSLTSGKNYRFVLKVTGTNQHTHKLYIDPDGQFLNSVITTISDDESQKITSTGWAKNEAVITQATGLVKVAIAIFQEGVKVSEHFEVTPISSSNYRFIQVKSDNACKFGLYFQIPDITGWTLYRSTNPDPFASTLPALQKSTLYDLSAGEVAYIRVPKGIQSYALITLLDNPCKVGKCPYNLDGNGDITIAGAHAGTTDRCICLQNKVYDWVTNKCLYCPTDPLLKGCTLFQPESSPPATELPFLKATYTYGQPKAFFKANSGQQVKVQFAKIAGETTSLTNSLSYFNNFNNPEEIPTTNNWQIVYTASSTGKLMAKSVNSQMARSVVKMSMFLDNILVKEHYQTAAQYFSDFANGDNQYRMIYEISTTKACKLKAYITGGSGFHIYPPGSNPSQYSQFYDQATYKFTDAQTPQTFNIDSAGKWYLEFFYPQDIQSGTFTVDLKTFSDNSCQNPCTQYLSATVLGLAPGTTDTCLCDDSSTPLVWNSVSKSCLAPGASPPAVCGNGVKETGQECDNRKQPGCTDCKIAAGYACVEDANKLSTCSIPFQVAFQKLNHKLGILTTHFYAEAGQKLLVTGSSNSQYQGTLNLKLYDPDNLEFGSPESGYLLNPITLTKTGTYKATLIDDYEPKLMSTKIIFKLDNVIIKEYYQIMPFSFNGKYKTLYEFTSTKTCKVKAYVTGTGLSSVTEFKISKPGSLLFNSGAPQAYVDSSNLKFTPSQLPFSFDIDVSGKWYIQVYEAGDGSKDLNLELKTFSVNGCQNPCTQYLSANVLGLAPGTTDTCLCDDSIRLIWDSSKKRCVGPAYPPKQLPFFKAKYYIGAPRVMFPIKKDQKLKVEFTKNGGNAATMKNLVTTGNYETKFQSTSTVYQEVCQFQNVYSAISQEQSEETINAVKISVSLDDKLVKQHYQSLGQSVTIDSTKYHRVLYEVSTTKACKVKAYFTISAIYGTPVLNGFNFRVYQPGNPVYPTSADELTSFSTYRFTDTDLPYTFDLTAAGKWYVQYLISNDNAAQFLTLDLKTLDTDACENPCSQYLSQTSVLGLAPGTTDTCLCDDTSAPTLWNSVSKKCEEVLFIVCGNGVKEDGEECDNKKQTGCTDCKVAAGYFCSEDQAKLSTCVQNRCGDSKKGGSEECDNGNTTGCIDCKVSSGYECSGGLGQKSTCTEKCGDGIRLAGEDCDNGGSAGCTNCKIDPGYNCVHNLYSKSLCLPICGDGIRAVTEECDNKNQTGCINCKPVPGFKCSGAVGAISDCKITCGDSVFGGSQQCDNGNQAGCSANCVPDKGYVCKNEVGARSVCSTVCGDGIKAGSEACDNGKKIGCLTCNQEDDGFDCTGAVGERSTCKSVCGDSKRQANEQCDNGNAAGCSKNCLPDIGYTCTGSIGAKSTCQTQCGDSIKAGTEACDNGKRKGCSNCIVQSGYSCKLAANMKTSVCSKA